MSTPVLKQTSYVVLGLVELCQPATPYDLKRFAEISVFNFWSIPHTQVYTECERLAGAGLLNEEREETGRRRRVYTLTKPGEEALAAWRSRPEFAHLELRDVGLIQLFFGADPAQLARVQVEGHRAVLERYEQLHAAFPDMPEGMRLALEAGIESERSFLGFWERLGGA